MRKEIMIAWLEEKIQQIKDTPVSVVDTKEKQHYLLGSLKTLELMKEQIEEGKFDVGE
ncbi:hypothetical protein N0M98_00800 [Paenibacillus doosanensis]|uniref:Uncharacterized protein n=1 Tax=Paenibacillus konkukensis TaxID=2020716 RepID=A0ABY4RY81_9BACL|nr:MULTISPECIES: hypothetical protein [Paenibacillus]MCS7458661.1 hypothetical protein [Paenibacillus doosanensis]UQZ86815.1 hypothetical protein SK3146_06108 [Paenibacillus konkukensis]